MVKKFCRRTDHLEERERVLMIKYYSKGEKREQLVVPECLIPNVLEKLHDKAGHFGADIAVL